MPHVIPNPFDNTLLVQGTPQDIEQIKTLLRQLDVAPRQVSHRRQDLRGGPDRRLQRGRAVRTSDNEGHPVESTPQRSTVTGGSGRLGVSGGRADPRTSQLLGVLNAMENPPAHA